MASVHDAVAQAPTSRQRLFGAVKSLPVALFNGFSNCEANQRADKRARRLFGYFVGCREKDEAWHYRRKRQELKGFF